MSSGALQNLFYASDYYKGPQFVWPQSCISRMFYYPSLCVSYVEAQKMESYKYFSPGAQLQSYKERHALVTQELD